MTHTAHDTAIIHLPAGLVGSALRLMVRPCPLSLWHCSSREYIVLVVCSRLAKELKLRVNKGLAIANLPHHITENNFLLSEYCCNSSHYQLLNYGSMQH